MSRPILMTFAAMTMLAAAPAIAQHGPGGSHGGGGAGAAGGNATGGPAGAALDARMNSMGPANASPNGIAHANSNSVLGDGTTTTTTRANARAKLDAAFPGTKGKAKVTSGSLSGLSAGTTLLSNGTAVGTVEQIRTSNDGTARVVLVQTANGRLFPIPANKLTYANGTLTTTARLNGVNGGVTAGTNPAIGIVQGPMHASTTGTAHASEHSVLAGPGSVPHR
jgi:hypothetical protein